MYSIQRGRGHLARNVTTLPSQLRGPLKQLIDVVEVRGLRRYVRWWDGHSWLGGRVCGQGKNWWHYQGLTSATTALGGYMAET